jgi:hypothetical protein
MREAINPCPLWVSEDGSEKNVCKRRRKKPAKLVSLFSTIGWDSKTGWFEDKSFRVASIQGAIKIIWGGKRIPFFITKNIALFWTKTSPCAPYAVCILCNSVEKCWIGAKTLRNRAKRKIVVFWDWIRENTSIFKDA